MNEVEQLVNIFKKMDVIDLTHTLEEGIPAWPSHAKYRHTIVETYKKGDDACHYEVMMSEHSGTHIDAPLHFIDGGKSIAEIPLTHFSGRAATIQVPTSGPLELLTKEHIIKWENIHGSLTKNDIVLVHFGWGKYWDSNPRQFLKDWPGVSEEAAQYFVEKQVKTVGTDVLAIDVFGHPDHPAHFVLLGNEVLIIENLKNLDLLPPFSFFKGYPLKIKDGSGSPIRALAYVSK